MSRIESRKIKEAFWDAGNMGDGDSAQRNFPAAALGRLSPILEEKRKRKRIKFSAFLKRQVRFVGWKIWLMQSVLLCALYAFFSVYAVGYMMVNIRYIAYFLCCLSVLVILSAAPVFYCSIRYTMYEVEIASRFSMIRLLLAKIIIIGAGDAVLLTLFLWITVFRTGIKAESALLYILFPALVSGAGVLYLLGHTPAGRFQRESIGLGCVLFGIFFLLKQFCPLFFTQTFSIGWAAVCLLLFCFCIGQFRYLLCSSAYARVQM
ncbi:MAG: hypothetical protein NC231_15125 [Bacillus sp. (in: Bacteria)]|nr:hypothetical protein [Bacillus sp. (in: firmicutes)]MCM1428128.1 hypothetical protein [Eubacterium sp.]